MKFHFKPKGPVCRSRLAPVEEIVHRVQPPVVRLVVLSCLELSHIGVRIKGVLVVTIRQNLLLQHHRVEARLVVIL